MDPLVASVLARASARGFLATGVRILAACSGGPDSTFLLRSLAAGRERFELGVLHVHHGLRGEEADADATFVEAIARELDLPFLLRPVDVPRERANRGRGSIETVARDLRYGAFVEAARSFRAGAVATGHTRDDLVETVLLGLLRGGGIRAAQGIPPERSISADPPVRVVRPLLEVSRGEILEALRRNAWAFRTDASNIDQGPLRNRVRARVLPLLREAAGPSLDASLARLAEEMREVEALLARLAGEFRDSNRGSRPGALPVEPLRSLPGALRLRVLREAIEEVAKSPASIAVLRRLEALLSALPGRAESGPGKSVAVREEDEILFLSEGPPVPPPEKPVPLPVPGEVEAMGFRFRAWFEPKAPPLDSLGPLDQAFDAASCAGSLCVRPRRPGDRFHPLGGPGVRKVSDFLIDRKVPRAVRDRIPIVACGDRVVWVVGHRIEEAVKVRPGTGRVLRLRAEPCPD